ncbi:protein PML-like [Rhinoraja longicauda]
MASSQVKEDGAGDAMQRESGAEIPSGGQDGPQQSTEETLVFFDLETTGLEKNCDIVQLSAMSGEKIFNKYILPSKSISEGAFAITGFQVLDGVLYLRGEPVQASSLQDTLEAFLHFLQSLATPLIIGHNIWKFDAPILLRVLQVLSMKEQFDSCITGFLDTLLLARAIIPRSEVNSYRQSELVKVFLKKGYDAHNAVEDAKSLQELYSVLKFTPEQKKGSQFSFSQLECQVSLQPLLNEKIIFSQFADKLAMQEVSFEKLQSTHQQDKEAGLKNFLRSLGHIEPTYIRLAKFFSK